MKNSKILAVILSAFILASCGTSHDVVDGGLFQKRKYNKGFHVSKKKKVSTTSGDNEAEVAANVTLEKADIKANTISLEPITNQSIVMDTEKETVATTVETEDNVTTTTPKEAKTTNKGVFAKNSRNMNRTQTKSLFNTIAPSSEIADSSETTEGGGLMNLILAIVLIIAIIMLLSFLDGLLGGLLSLILLIVVIVVLLRYFGVI
jgi:hypothetical protein